MNWVDFLLLLALAMADLLLLAHLRQRRRRQLLLAKIHYSLVLAIRQANQPVIARRPVVSRSLAEQ